MFKKWVGGAKKHGGIFNAIVAETDKIGRELDKNAGNVSHLVSSIPEKKRN